MVLSTAWKNGERASDHKFSQFELANSWKLDTLWLVPQSFTLAECLALSNDVIHHLNGLPSNVEYRSVCVRRWNFLDLLPQSNTKKFQSDGMDH